VRVAEKVNPAMVQPTSCMPTGYMIAVPLYTCKLLRTTLSDSHMLVCYVEN